MRLTAGAEALADVVRRSTPTASTSPSLQLHQPSLDDVFLEKTGRSLEGADDDEDEADAAGVAEAAAR